MYDCFMQKLIYRKFILGTGGVENRKYLKEALKRGLGGVIFFTRDIDSREQFKDLTEKIKSMSKEPLFLSIDQEGGRVERTEKIHARYLSPKFAYEKGEKFLKIQTEKIAHELKEYGINLNFAPCADVNTNPLNPIIGERAFSDNPEVVSKCVKIVSDIYRKNDIIPCLKHFPGHGEASKDSHFTLPVIDLPLGEMERVHIKPFIDNINAEMIMAAHLHCTCFDSDPIPTSLSQNAIGYLRNVLKYKGVVITDDMVMKGVQAFGSLNACETAIRAGVDMFIFRDVNAGVLDMIDSLTGRVESDAALRNAVLESDLRIEKLKKERLK